MKWLKTIFTWWDGPTFGTWLDTRRHGREVGRDDQGNVYYGDKEGKRRWVVYNGPAEASRIPPEWFLWLHRTVDAPPSQTSYAARTWERPHRANPTGTSEAHAMSGSLNMSGLRPRATGDYEAWVPD